MTGEPTVPVCTITAALRRRAFRSVECVCLLDERDERIKTGERKRKERRGVFFFFFYTMNFNSELRINSAKRFLIVN